MTDSNYDLISRSDKNHGFGVTYHLMGVLHRLGGPAFVSDGLRSWWKNGERHRICGPAIEYPDGEELTLMQFVNHDLVSDETVQEVLTKWI